MIPKARAMKEETPMSGQEATAVLQERPCGEGEDEPPTEVGQWVHGDGLIPRTLKAHKAAVKWARGMKDL